MTSTPVSPPLAVIGGGNMAQAILAGFRAAAPTHAFAAAVAEPDAAKHPRLAPLADAVVPDGPAALRWLRERETPDLPGQVLLAVKPQSLPGVAAELRPHLDRRRVVISILAGTPTRTIRDLLGPNAAVVRAMPNLPARIRQGATAICLGDGAAPGDDDFALALFRGIGPLVLRIDESLMDAFTAVAGSGPAYLFYLAEAMTRAATELGFDETAAREIVKATLAGSASLLAQSSESPADLRAAVTSKGGTTEAATTVLDNAGVMNAIVRAITAARDRGRELANH